MDNDWNRWLRERAYALWEEEGRPDGRHQHHWRDAEEEFAARKMNNAANSGQQPLGNLEIPENVAIAAGDKPPKKIKSAERR